MFAYLLKRKQANNVLNRHKSNVHFMFANKHTYNLVMLFTNQLDFFPDNSSLGETRQHLDARKDRRVALCARWGEERRPPPIHHRGGAHFVEADVATTAICLSPLFAPAGAFPGFPFWRD